MNTKLLALYSLKFHPFHADVPTEALYTTPVVDAFLRRVELTLADGGFAMLTGDPGTGKTIAMRLLVGGLNKPRKLEQPGKPLAGLAGLFISSTSSWASTGLPPAAPAAGRRAPWPREACSSRPGSRSRRRDGSPDR